MYIPKYRKLQQVYRLIKEHDPNSAISEHLIEKLIKEGKLNCIKLNNAWLINLDELYGCFYSKENKNEKDDNGSNM